MTQLLFKGFPVFVPDLTRPIPRWNLKTPRCGLRVDQIKKCPHHTAECSWVCQKEKICVDMNLQK